MDKLLQNEIFVRVFSVILAILIWFQAQGAGTGTTSRSIAGVPVQTIGLPDNMVVTDVTPPTVQVNVSGSAQLINDLDTSKVGASVNLSAAQPGRHTYFAQVQVPPGVQLVSYKPQDITVVAEPVIEREKPVIADTVDTPAMGFGVVGPVQVEPNVVVVQGPSSAVDQVVNTVAKVSVLEARSNVVVQAQPQAVDVNGRAVPEVSVLPRQVQATVPIGPTAPHLAVPVQAVITGQPAPGYTVTGVSTSPESVLLLGPTSVLSDTTAVRTQAISVAGASSSLKESVVIVQPPGAQAVDPTSVTVTVTIAKGAASSGKAAAGSP